MFSRDKFSRDKLERPSPCTRRLLRFALDPLLLPTAAAAAEAEPGQQPRPRGFPRHRLSHAYQSTTTKPPKSHWDLEKCHDNHWKTHLYNHHNTRVTNRHRSTPSTLTTWLANSKNLSFFDCKKGVLQFRVPKFPFFECHRSHEHESHSIRSRMALE